MCELFAYSGQQPALLRLTFAEFAAHGAGQHNADGWGLAHYLDGDVRLLKDVGASNDSACLRFLEQHPLRSDLIISHIRHATQGARVMRNCQPFVREMGGAMHVFAHNGNLNRDRLAALREPGCFAPVGDTDSEQAFCLLLERLRAEWRSAGGRPSLGRRHAVVSEVAGMLRALGPANFLYADGEVLFAHGHRRTHPGEGIRPPGLHLMCLSCTDDTGSLRGAGLHVVGEARGADQALVASVPLNDDPRWRPFDEGELVVLRLGREAPAA